MKKHAARSAAAFLAASLALAGAVATASAQEARQKAAPAQGAAAAAMMHTELVKTGLYLIRGGGGNSLLRFTANGMLLVDGKSPGNYRAMMSQVRRVSKLSDMSVRALILTDYHDDHAGNQAQFAAAGVQIVAQQNAIRHLPTVPMVDGKTAPPAFTYDRDYSLRMGGAEAQLKHFGNARTDGDTVVYFPDLKVVAIGDLYSADGPEADFAAGGSLVGWGPVLGRILKLDFDTVVPSDGPIVTRASLEAFKVKVDTLVARAGELVRQGCAKDQLMARLKTDDLGWHLSLSGESLDRFYAELADVK